MDKICIIGAGGHGREIIQILEDINKIQNKYKILGFTDDKKELKSKIFNGYPVIGSLKYVIDKIEG